MEATTRNRRFKSIFIIASVCIAVLVVFFVFSMTRKQSDGNQPPNGKNGTDTTVISDETPPPDEETPLRSDTPKTPPTTDFIVCKDNSTVTTSFTLTSLANVYTTALDAKNKTNPALLYEPGEYSVYKCYDDMANITHTTGVPGGWIDPNHPYQAPTSSSQTPSPPSNPLPPALNVMTLDNTTVNWSHEYPTAFVKDHNGVWNISTSKLYLTFDCGYDYNNLAASIMDTLRSKGVTAVFFVTGDFMTDRSDLVRRMVNEGHVVGNHSYAHLNQPQNLGTSTDTVVADIRAWEAAYRNITGSNPSVAYFRPPAGSVSKRSMALMDQLGYKTLMWGAAYKDWDTNTQPSRDTAMTLLRQYTTPGDIVLLHGISQTSNDILAQYIDEYRGKGYVFSLP